jgi:acyl-CoA synthetase (AMP-forming)/AMP-acid ligase II
MHQSPGLFGDGPMPKTYEVAGVNEAIAAVSLGELARIQAQLRGAAPAFVFEGRTTSFAEFDVYANRVANGLIGAGLPAGARICHLGKNTDFYFELLFGAMRASVVMVPLNWRLATPELVYLLEDCKAQALFVGPEFVDLARKLVAEASSLRLVVAMEGGAAEWQPFPEWRDGQSAEEPQRNIAGDDIALQLYTSGTTGRPKGAMIRHSCILGPRRLHAQNPPEWNRWSEDDISLVAMPNFHIGGTGWGISGFMHGARSIVVREFDPGRVLEYIARDRISKIFMVPAALQIVVRQPRAREIDYSCLKHILYGASPIPLELLRECMEVFSCGFVQMYGLTETTGTIVVLPPEDHDPRGTPRMRSAGKPLPGVEIRIVDEKGHALPPHEVGEIATRSLSNMAGYWNLPEVTGQILDSDGWLRTGDAGYVDEDGYVYVHDRVKDMIISGGENIYPAEVENAIFGQPDVADVAVIGVPDERWGEAVKAIVVRKPGRYPTAEDVIAWARERIAGYKVPKSVEFVERLPRNPSGKILRRELREPYWVGRERRVN